MLKKIFVALAVITFLSTNAWAKETLLGTLKSVEFLTGFSSGQLHGKDAYQSIPLIMDFDFDMKPLTSKIHINPPSILQWGLEPYISPVISPNSNVELGNMFMLKLGLVPEDWKIQPYIRAGAGMLYMTQHTREQSTQFNFAESGGLGVHFFIKKNLGLTVEGRFRHLSNAGIDEPNHGINSYFALSGITYQF